VERGVPAARRQEAAARLDAYDRHLDELRKTVRASAMTLAAIRAELAALGALA
jgi:hypothetical protein